MADQDGVARKIYDPGDQAIRVAIVSGGGGGGGSPVAVDEAGVEVTAGAERLNFTAGFDVTEPAPDEITVALDLSEYTGADLPVAGGGTGAGTAAAARTNLGLEIGVDVAAPGTGGPPTGTAGGDLSGTYPNPSVADDSHAHTGTTISALDAADLTTGTIADARLPTLGGDVSGTLAAVVVADDSHAHTGTTISALDAADTTTGTFDAARIPTLDHGTGLTGLTDDDHTQYARLAGRAGGQLLAGGTANTDNLNVVANTGTNAGDVIIQAGSDASILGGTTGTVGALLTNAVFTNSAITLTGATNITGNTAITGNETVSGTLGVTGALTAGSFDQSTLRGAVACLASNNNSGVTVTTTTAATTIWNGTLYSIPAGSLVAGDSIDILATTAILNNNAVGDVEFTIHLGATTVLTIGTTGNLIPVNATTRQSRLVATMHFATIGASATMYCNGQLIIGDVGVAASADAIFSGARNQNNTGINTTGALAVDIKAKMDASSANFTVAGRYARIMRANAP